MASFVSVVRDLQPKEWDWRRVGEPMPGGDSRTECWGLTSVECWRSRSLHCAEDARRLFPRKDQSCVLSKITLTAVGWGGK